MNLVENNICEINRFKAMQFYANSKLDGACNAINVFWETNPCEVNVLALDVCFKWEGLYHREAF